MKENKCYKIQYPDKKYSAGGCYPILNRTKAGKIWKSKLNFHLHLTMLQDCNRLKQYNYCEVIEYELIENRRIPMKEYLQEEWNK